MCAAWILTILSIIPLAAGYAIGGKTSKYIAIGLLIFYFGVLAFCLKEVI